MLNDVAILMATYNGEKYIREQINSILSQTYPHFELYISDDGSTDETLNILTEYSKSDKRVHINNSSHEGACQNFARLINEHKDAEYVMLCDQDDVWEKHKIEKSIEVIKRFNHGPVLLYSDRIYVDSQLRPIKMPQREYTDDLKSLLCQCHIYGCAILMNKELLDLISIPSYAQMHDHWIALVAARYGTIIHLHESLMLYRQHNSNVTGGLKQLSLIGKLRRWDIISKSDRNTIRMCYKFCKNEGMGNKTTSDYMSIFQRKNKFLRLYRAIRFGYKQDHFTATIRGLFGIMNCSI